MSRSRITILFYLISFALLTLFLSEINFKQLPKNLNLIGWGFLPIFLCSTVSSLLATLAWFIAIGHLKKLRWIRKLFIVRNIGESLSTINPLGVAVGDTIKYQLAKIYQIDTSRLASSLLIVRTLTIMSFLLLVLFVVGFKLSLIQNEVFLTLSIICLSIFLILSLVYFCSHKNLLIYKSFRKIGHIFKFKIKHSSYASIKKINLQTSILFVRHKKKVFVLLILLFFHWVFGGVEFYLILYYLDAPVTFTDAMFLEIGASFIRSIFAFIPGQIGIDEYTNKMMLNVMNIHDNDKWVALNLIKRFRQVLWIFISVVFYFIEFKFKKIEAFDIQSELASGDIIHQS